MLKKLLPLTLLVITGALSAQSTSPQDQLESAVSAGDAAKIKAAVKAGANPNARNWAGHILGGAATNGNLKAVRALIEAGAEVNIASSGGWTALMGAADNGHLDVVRYLVSRSADVNATTRQGRTAIMRAAFHGQTAVIQFLLTKGGKATDVDSMGATALMLAAQQGYDKTVKVLLDAGADRNAKTSTQKTALMLAQEAQAQNGGYRAEEFKRTIALLSGAEKKSLGKLIGKVFGVDGKKIVVKLEGAAEVSVGTRLKIKTSSGEIPASVREALHTKIKATAAKEGAEKGDKVYLEK